MSQTTIIMTIRADQLGTFLSFDANGNGSQRSVTLEGVKPYGDASQLLTITVTQVDTGVTQFQKGQLVTIKTADGTILFQSVSIDPEAEGSRGAGDEHLIFFGQKYFIDLAGVKIGSRVFNPSSEKADPSKGDNDGQLDFGDLTIVPCFTPGTLILTSEGERAASSLTVGDLVATRDHGQQRIIWISKRDILLRGADDPQRPVRIRAGALGGGLPLRDLTVSPQHRMLVAVHDRKAGGSTQRLVPAKALIGQPGITSDLDAASVTYIAILLERHGLLQAEGALTESFYPGPYIMRQLPILQRQLVKTLVPALHHDPEGGYGPHAAPILSVGEARRAFSKASLLSAA